MAYKKEEKESEGEDKIKKLLIVLVLSLFIKTNVNANGLSLNVAETFVDSMINQDSNLGIKEITIEEEILIGSYTLTAYCPCSYCCGNPNGITASGARVQANHTIAADTSVLPFGTVVYINGEDYTVEDIGSAVNGNHIDIYFDSHSEANAFGRRREDVYIRKEVKKMFKEVNFVEYIMISGDFMTNGTANSYIDETKSSVTWKTPKGEIVATRTKNLNGQFEHMVDKDIYEKWKARR